MPDLSGDATDATDRDWLLYLVGVIGLAACIALRTDGVMRLPRRQDWAWPSAIALAAAAGIGLGYVMVRFFAG